ncbi:N,N-dimethylformamidase beta subunit family domain-containing protein [Aquincola sp. MAHUQ-54]|uniref:N,N-dimethylformamidase beta subunit family domain-containing protein n=1 Tax=Aquincola agrisoli TaxID=3119538 RepID=A0AAW9QA63_9BURK
MARTAGILARARLLRRLATGLWLWLAAMLAPPALALPAEGPGGPILVITSGTANNGPYLAEILRNEGLNLFAVADIANVDAALLASYEVVVLAKMALPAARVDDLTAWVQAGGNLIALAPDAALSPLLGLASSGQPALANGFVAIDTTRSPGNGLVKQTLQFHGGATRYLLDGATPLAALYLDATTPAGHPALTLRAAGAGKAAAFAYDLATSVVQTRQGNPAWAAQERDGFAPIRSDDKFYGAAAGDPQPDWVDRNRVRIPQADEQQRLLANLILQMNQNRRPLPRFWYWPHGHKAVVVMTGDDHGNAGTVGRFEQYRALSPPGCSVADWQCIRATSYVYPSTPISDAQATAYAAEGFEVGLHVSTSCFDYTQASLAQTYADQLASWRARFASVPAPRTQRHHCIVWSDWTSGALVQLANGMRLDTSYYFWPPGWVANTPGFFNGSAMPMRFADPAGGLIDVFLAATQMTDESDQSYPMTVDTLLDGALGADGFYGAYVVNAHTDLAASEVSDAVVASARARGVPIISAEQLLAWLDGRNAAAFGLGDWTGGTLQFSVAPGLNTNGLQSMLPLRWGTSVLSALQRNGTPVAWSLRTVKGVEYAAFAADGGTYAATYGADTERATVTGATPASGATGVAVAATVTATFSEAMDPATVNTDTVELRNAAGVRVAATVSYDAATRTATLVPAAPLGGNEVHTAAVRGDATFAVRDPAGQPVMPASWSFTTGDAPAAPTCPCQAWPPGAQPAVPSFPDPGAVELGVRFRTDLAGFITGIRFYKGSGNTGTHVGSLWTSGGQLLARATFGTETATGWQQVDFASPVAIAANTVYIASYHAPNGGYAATSGFFATTGVDTPPMHLLRDGVAGGNGLYAYSGSPTFPNATYQSTNYWVDAVFVTAPADTVPPTVTSTSPAAGATGVATNATVSAVFSEAMDAASITAATVELRDAANALVPASVGYAAASRTATLVPANPLVPAASYSATVKGGPGGVRDVAGNALASASTWSFATAGSPECAAPANPIVGENCLPGSPPAEWDVAGIGDPSIQGFATQMSVNRGDTVVFKVDTTAADYRIDIYRIGYYGGQGARKVDTVLPTAALPQQQPACLNQAATGLIDCGNWAVSGGWAVPMTATSGIYLARLRRADTGGASHMVFVVRDDASTAPILFQTSDTTWQAYNNYGGRSLYQGGPGTNPARAYKVSYNRPFATRGVDGGQDWLFNAEYPMVRWLESNGYDVGYIAGADTDRAGAMLLQRKVFLSVGHDEYWTAGQRASVEAARNAGVHLAFFSGNEMFWKARWEPGIDATAAAYRTLVSYKETHANAKIDPSPQWTGTWRDPRFSPPADGGRPENAVTGTLFMVNAGATTAIVVPSAEGKMRFWRNTSVATLAANASATLAASTLGYEWDVVADNAVRPPGLFTLSRTSVANAPVLQDHGSTYASGTAVHGLTLYRHASGARVFGAGTVQWSWGLDAVHDRAGPAVDVRMQQATVNLLADMGVQPATLRPDLIFASPSTDATAPASTITSPAQSAVLRPGTAVTITGTATDAGGVVAAVEVSVDGGTTWRLASGRSTWTYSWTPTATGSATLRSRAVDDSGNVQVPGAGVTVSVQAADVTPPTITAVSPGVNATNVSRTTNVTVTFSEAMTASTITATTIELFNPSGAKVSATVTYNASTRTATLNPASTLAAQARYTARVRGGSTDPRVKDAAGNALQSTATWSFRTR